MRVSEWLGDRENLSTLTVVLLALLILEIVIFVGLVLSYGCSEVPEVPDLVTVYDEPAHTIIYVDAACPMCGSDRTIATTSEIICQNESCEAYGQIQRNPYDYTGLLEEVYADR